MIVVKEGENASNFIKYKGTTRRTSDGDLCPVLEKQRPGKATSILDSQRTQMLMILGFGL